MRLHHLHDHRPVVGDDDLRGGTDFERLTGPTGAGAGEALVEPFVVHAGNPRRVEDRQPPVGDLGGQRDVLRAFGAQHHRDVRTQRMGDGLERLAQTRGALTRERQGVVRAVAGNRGLAGPDLAQDVDVLAGARQRLRELLPVPALDDLRTRHTQPQDVAATRQVVERQRCHGARRGRAGRHLNDRRTQAHPRGFPAPPGQRGVGIRAPGLRGEDGVEPRFFRRGDERRVIGGRLGAPVSELQTEFHGAAFPNVLATIVRTCSTRCRER